MAVNNKNGLSLLELLVVVTVISVLVTLSVILFSQGTMASREASAIGSLRTIMSAQNQFKLSHPTYGTLVELKEGRLILDPDLASGSKSGYLFQTNPYQGGQYRWYAEGIPQTYNSSGVRSLYIDETGVFRIKDTGLSEFKPREEASLWEVMQ